MWKTRLQRQNYGILLARNPGSNLFADGQAQNNFLTCSFWKELTLITVHRNNSKHLVLEVITEKAVAKSK